MKVTVIRELLLSFQLKPVMKIIHFKIFFILRGRLTIEKNSPVMRSAKHGLIKILLSNIPGIMIILFLRLTD